MSSLTGNNYNAGQNLENSTPVSNDINDITQRITDITYDSTTDTTTISNNLVITSPKILTINGYNVDARMDGLETDLGVVETSIVTIQNVNDVQDDDIDNLQADMTSAQTDITALEQKTTGIFYDGVEDLTTIDNDMTVSIGKILYVDGQDVDQRFNNIEHNMTGIAYDTGSDATTITNTYVSLVGNINQIGDINSNSNHIYNLSNVYVNSGGNYFIGGVPIVSAPSLLSSNNTWIGTNAFTNTNTTATTQAVNTNNTTLATTAFTQTQIAYLKANANTWTGTNAFTNSNTTAVNQAVNTSNNTLATTYFTLAQIDYFRTHPNTWTALNSFNVSPSVPNLLSNNITNDAVNSRFIAQNCDRYQAVGTFTLDTDFYYPFNTSPKFNDDTFSFNNVTYVLNALGLFSSLSNRAGAHSLPGHQGIVTLAVYDHNDWAVVTHASPYLILGANFAYYECVFRNVYSDWGDVNFCVGITDGISLTKFMGWQVVNGWQWKFMINGMYGAGGTEISSYNAPDTLIDKWISVKIWLIGTTVYSVWNNLTDNVVSSFSYNISSFYSAFSTLYISPCVYVKSLNVLGQNFIYEIDYLSIKYYCNRT